MQSCQYSLTCGGFHDCSHILFVNPISNFPALHVTASTSLDQKNQWVYRINFRTLILRKLFDTVRIPISRHIWNAIFKMSTTLLTKWGCRGCRGCRRAGSCDSLRPGNSGTLNWSLAQSISARYGYGRSCPASDLASRKDSSQITSSFNKCSGQLIWNTH